MAGGGGYNEIDENSPLYNPNIYGISKLIGEEMLRQSGIKRVLCLRLPTVLSVSDNGSFLFKWLNSAIHNRDITAFNMQNKLNNFISINSLFDFIFNIKLYDGFDIINLGSSGNLSIYEFIEYLKQKTNSKSNLKDLGKNSFFSLNLSKAAIKYGFCPLSSEQSIDEWLQNRYERFYKLRTRPKSSNSIFF
uniref:hypothetical protein n=1 Tax=Campylobacter fetus TaxID=196 RepID=UPI003AF95755